MAAAVDAGPDKSFGHGVPTDDTTKAGHMLHLDFAIRLNGYCTDLQRMFFFGGPSEVPTELREACDTSSGAIRAACESLRPGVRGYQVDRVAREYLESRGYEEYMYALAHNVGRRVHDGGLILGPRWPRYGAVVTGRVEAGNVFAVEPRVETAGHGQLSLEEIVLVTDGGTEFLSDPQTELFCIPA